MQELRNRWPSEIQILNAHLIDVRTVKWTGLPKIANLRSLWIASDRSGSLRIALDRFETLWIALEEVKMPSEDAPTWLNHKSMLPAITRLHA